MFTMFVLAMDATNSRPKVAKVALAARVRAMGQLAEEPGVSFLLGLG
jgi:hypothetical protein